MKLDKWALGLAVVGVVSLAPVARAANVVEVNDINGTNGISGNTFASDGNTASQGTFKGQVFTAETNGLIDQLVLGMYAYNNNLTTPLPILIYDLTTSTSNLLGYVVPNIQGAYNYSVGNGISLDPYTLTNGDKYRIAVNVGLDGNEPGNPTLENVGWEIYYIPPADPIHTNGVGSLEMDYVYSNNGLNWTTYNGGNPQNAVRYIDVEVRVPEPGTQALMIFAALAWLVVGAGRWGLRRFKPAV